MKKDINMIIRTIVLGFALLNQTLFMMGYSPLPISDQELEALITAIFSFVMVTISWWKDNDVSKESRERKAKLEELEKQETK